MHRKYEKVQRIEKPECDGILNGTCFVFEKADGANGQCWLDADGQLCCGSRNHQISRGDNVAHELRGFVSYIRQNELINNLLTDYPRFRLYGEWLVHHTVIYPENAYNKFYVFDVYDHESERYLVYDEYSSLLEEYGVLYLKPFDVLENPTVDDLKEMLGRSQFDIPQAEGIVVKNYDFVNRHGHSPYGKMVTKEFREVNAMVFNHAPRSFSVETRIISRYVTKARVAKIANKIVEEVERQVEIEDTARVLSSVYYDIISEDMWDIIKRFKNPTIDFANLRRESDRATKNHFFAYLQERSNG